MRGGGRRVGWIVLALVIAAGAEALTFRVSFPTDPIGPRGFPLVAVALLLLGPVALLRAPRGSPAGRQPLDRRLLVRMGLATLSFVLYALLLPRIGFVAATAGEFAALALLFGGRPVRSGLVGLALAVALYVVFVLGLGLPLPVGTWLS